jgi:hypothetical protein
MKLKPPIIFALFLLTLVTVFIVIAIGYPARARFGPLAVGIPAGILLCMQILLDIKRKNETRTAEQEAIEYRGLGLGRSYIKIFAWIGGLLVIPYFFGILITFPLFTLAYIKLNGWRWSMAILMAAGVFVLLYGVFVLILQVYLYPGIFLE